MLSRSDGLAQCRIGAGGNASTHRLNRPPTMQISDPLTLPNGAVIPNRLAKAAMEEGLAGPGQLPDQALFTLYERWATGGAGLLITGNVMVDHRALTGPGGVVLEQGTDLKPFTQWAQAGRLGGAQLWMQINHPGRQIYAAMGGVCQAPSEVALELGKHSKLFGMPRAMTQGDIAEVITRFAQTAQLASQAGFTGVQIHAAHGYLLSQFLSPRTNRRKDQWGGDIAGRSRLLLEIVGAVRRAVPADFCVAVKLNSADFQRSGFDLADARYVVQCLNGLAVDLLELSGGSYESPAMQGRTSDGRTLAREAYFLEFAQDIAQLATMPVMTTGGIRRLEVAQTVLGSGVAMVGMGTALAAQPDLPRRWLAGDALEVGALNVPWRDKVMASVATMALIRRQIHDLAYGVVDHAAKRSPVWALLREQLFTWRLTRRYRNWLRAPAQ